MKSYHLYVSPPESRKIVTSKVAVHFAIIPTPKEHLLLFPNFHFNPVLLIATSIGKKTLNSTSVNTSQAEASLKRGFCTEAESTSYRLGGNGGKVLTTASQLPASAS